MRAVALVVVVAACHSPRGDDLRHTNVDSWKLDRARFERLIVAPFRDAYDGYAAHFDDHVGELRAALAHAGAMRRHFAGDRRLTPSQARLRWTLPVMYPSFVVEGVDTVFVRLDDHWYALAGLDDAILDRARALDPGCAERLAGPVTDMTWLVADAAMRSDHDGFARACRLAAMTR